MAVKEKKCKKHEGFIIVEGPNHKYYYCIKCGYKKWL